MLKPPKPAQFTWLIIALCLSPLSYAHAYLDPGSGSYAIQIIIGLIVGASYTFKSFGGKLVSRLRNRSGKPQDDVE